MILGTNGAGKSTVLDGMALALLSPLIASSGYHPYSLIRRTNRGEIRSAKIVAQLILSAQDGLSATDDVHQSLVTTINRRGSVEFVNTESPLGPLWERMYDDRSSAFFFVGYGAMRRVEAVSANDLAVRRKARLLKYERVASLFEDHFALVPLDTWLPEWEVQNPGRYRQVVNLIDKLTPTTLRFTGAMEDGEYLFRQNGLNVPFTALSDGYRAYVGWVGDLLHHLCMGAPSGARLVESRGVVMVDEIDLHIHPSGSVQSFRVSRAVCPTCNSSSRRTAPLLWAPSSAPTCFTSAAAARVSAYFAARGGNLRAQPLTKCCGPMPLDLSPRATLDLASGSPDSHEKRRAGPATPR